MLAIAGMERFFAVLLHIGLSIIVLQGVVRKRFTYLAAAIVIHTFIDAMIGILPVFIPLQYVLVSIEGTLIVVSISLFIYCLYIKRKEVSE